MRDLRLERLPAFCSKKDERQVSSIRSVRVAKQRQRRTAVVVDLPPEVLHGGERERGKELAALAELPAAKDVQRSEHLDLRRDLELERDECGPILGRALGEHRLALGARGARGRGTHPAYGSAEVATAPPGNELLDRIAVQDELGEVAGGAVLVRAVRVAVGLVEGKRKLVGTEVMGHRREVHRQAARGRRGEVVGHLGGHRDVGLVRE